jgi:hypothetical protein
MKYKVQCQVMFEYEVEAGSEREAEDKGLDLAINECMYEADGIDFCVSAHKQDGESAE